MLRNPTFLSVLRQKPLQTTISRARLRLGTPSSPSLHSSRPNPRLISTVRNITRPTGPLSAWRSSLLRRTHNFRRNSTQQSPRTAQKHGDQQALSLSGRFRELSRKYGWAAVGVYVGLSVLDFPFCFLAVRLIGPDRIGEAENAIIHGFWRVVATVAPSMQPAEKITVEEAEAAVPPTDMNGHKIKENASIWTQLLLAYGVHKSLIFFRIPLTAAVTPKVVKTLRSWGWNVGKRGNFARKPGRAT